MRPNFGYRTRTNPRAKSTAKRTLLFPPHIRTRRTFTPTACPPSLLSRTSPYGERRRRGRKIVRRYTVGGRLNPITKLFKLTLFTARSAAIGQWKLESGTALLSNTTRSRERSLSRKMSSLSRLLRAIRGPLKSSRSFQVARRRILSTL